MKKLILLTLLTAFLGCSAPQKELDNLFYAFSNAGNLPNAPEDLESKVDLFKSLGYDGWAGHYSVDDNPGRRAALEQAGLVLPEIYWRLNIDSTGSLTYKEGLKEAIADSKGKNLVVTFIIRADAFNENQTEGDPIVVKAIQELADYAAPYGVRLAAYPHVNVYCETVEHSLRIAKMADRENVGSAFNLPHFLKKEGDKGWQKKLSATLPYLYMVSICGADAGDTQDMSMRKLMQPLGEGTYDPYPIVKFLKDNNYDGQIGLQCYNIKQDAEVALSKSISTWRMFQKRYSEETENIKAMKTESTYQVKLMTLDPGHFHAALIQKVMYKGMDPKVYIYAPDGPDLGDHLNRIEGFNTRAENPTSWDLEVYKGDDFFEKMISEKPGNLMNVSGNNAKKSEYILKTIEAGIHVLADKPMVIKPEEFPELQKAFKIAEEKGVLLYDIMTERHEITTILQRELSQLPGVFGEILTGSPEEPAITKESVHHFFKYVSGSPLKRPAWFFDTEQQGEGIVDVNTHLVDLIQWEAFPEVILSTDDVEIVSSKRWTTDLSPGMFKKVTHLEEYPGYLLKDVEDGILKVYSNGEINYKLKGIYAKASVIWNYQAPEGSADTHYSIMRGSKCNLIIAQGEKEGYKPKLYIEGTGEEDITPHLVVAINELSTSYPGLSLEETGDLKWAVNIPDKYKLGHEAHFGQVTEKYLRYLKEGKLPDWEVPNMITKYYTTTEALKMAE